MAADTTDPSYWLNWRFRICALYILGVIMFGSFLIWKYEGKKKLDNERRERGIIPAGVLYKDEVWKTCVKCIHPAFLLAFRIVAFVLLLAILLLMDLASFSSTLSKLLEFLASALSLYGCWLDCGGVCHLKATSQNIDAEQGPYVAPKLEGSANTSLLKSSNNQEVHVHHIADCMGYLLQIMYQVTAGSVLLTDVVFWLVIYPFLTSKDYRLAFFDVSMHSVNILILGDSILNCMRYPMFRIAYFILWTGVFVICQWIIHTCVSLRWPYPFMDLSPPYAPICGLVAYPMLWCLLSDSQIEAPVAFKIVFRVLSGYKLKRTHSACFVQKIYRLTCRD